MLKKILWAILGIVIAIPIVGGIAGIKLSQFEAMREAGANRSRPPTRVNAAIAKEVRWHPHLSAVGTVVPIKGATLTADSDGTIQEILYTPGSEVKAGEELIRFDTDVQKAQLNEAEVTLNRAKIAYKRARELNRTRNISRSDMDTAETNVQQAEARARYFRTVIARKTLRAPFAGKLGISHVSEGQYISRGTPIVSLQSLDPIYVHFSVPQKNLKDIKEGLKIKVTTDAYPDQVFLGRISAIDPEIDPATRSIRVQVTLDNPKQKLRPGMFVSLNISLDRTVNLIFIPATAVLYGSYGNSVFVIEEQQQSDQGQPGLQVRQQLVRLGIKQGDFVAVSDGLEAGTRVVSTGSFKLMPNMPVEIDNSLAPEFKLDPSPSNN
ncbi:MAG: efflux transporter periplasmic adaptor subunit [Proteobacteria bacterium]|nr:MAG: efflux transporter periplasmic adaptor subunit [Pseudomonadota bacterium]PIE40101.1 MAG: efflux transporter periplasmic adaptor subunit [Gammaproteobacteria bacterium]